ncbi:hypothetical protein SAMN05428978_10749 [Nitrosomonas sp. Nm34]|nr:hypothetical protein SAMN05428978_10749 [Nitrosomonas sp. Nm34]
MARIPLEELRPDLFVRQPIVSEFVEHRLYERR